MSNSKCPEIPTKCQKDTRQMRVRLTGAAREQGHEERTRKGLATGPG